MRKSIILLAIFLASCVPYIYRGITKVSYSLSNYSYPVWSNSGKKVAVSDNKHSINKSIIYIFDLTNISHKIFLESQGFVRVIGWTVDDTKIVLFSDGVELHKKGIWLIDINDMNLTFIGKGFDASFLPGDSSVLILDCDDSNKIRLYSIDLKSGQITEIYSGEKCISNFDLAVSKDGKKVAYSVDDSLSAFDFDLHVYIFDLESGKSRLLSESSSWSPTWSKDGNSLAFLKLSANKKESILEIVDIKNQENSVNYELPIPMSEISWSPDGQEWAITGGGDLFIVDIEEFIQN